jgi:hypothetical protein
MRLDAFGGCSAGIGRLGKEIGCRFRIRGELSDALSTDP